MALTKVLISVKTYPTLSERYDELVCTAGFREDGSWIRIYPIPFRKLKVDSKYQKWQWVEIDITKNTKDFRKESYRPTSIDNEIRKLQSELLEMTSKVEKINARKQIITERKKYEVEDTKLHDTLIKLKED